MSTEQAQTEKPKLPMYERDLVFFDLETTGLDPFNCGIIQIAAYLRTADRKEEAAFKVYIELSPFYVREEQAMQINGYSEEKWKAAGAIPIAEALKGFSNFVTREKGCILAAWNPVFDMSFLRNAYKVWNIAMPKAVDYHVLDVASIAWPLVQNRAIETIKLSKVCEYLGISNEGEHDAGVDVERMVKVYDHFLVCVYQHRCDGCGILLEAFGRHPQESSGPGGKKEIWSCEDCKLSGAAWTNASSRIPFGRHSQESSPKEGRNKVEQDEYWDGQAYTR